jgi:hypothetical protein
VRVRADYGGHAAIKIPAHGNFFGGSFGVEIHKDYFCFNLLQQLVGGAEWIVVRRHEHATLQVDHGVRDLSLLTLIEAPAGHIRGIVGGAQDAARGAMAVAFDHLKVIDDFASLVPYMITGGDDIDIQFEELFGERGSDSETGSGVLAVGDDQVNELVAHDAGKTVRRKS